MSDNEDNDKCFYGQKRYSMSQDTKKLIIGSIIVPIVCALSSVFISEWFKGAPVQYVYSDKPSLEEFNINEYFPLKEGNRWEYKCDYTGQYEGNGITKGSCIFEMRVKKVYVTDNYKLIDMQGDIFSIGNTPENYKDARFGLLIFSNKIYYVVPKVIDELIDNIQNDKMDGMIKEPQILFEFPLFHGQKIGDVKQIFRHDLRYLTNVTKEHDFHTKKVGESIQETKSVYKISFVSNPEEYSMTFVPGLGITTKEYHHKGTKDDRKIVLTKYKLQ